MVCRLATDFNTIANFRKDNDNAIRNIVSHGKKVACGYDVAGAVRALTAR